MICIRFSGSHKPLATAEVGLWIIDENLRWLHQTRIEKALQRREGFVFSARCAQKIENAD